MAPAAAAADPKAAAKPKPRPVRISFHEEFQCRDQDVSDLSNPRPETRFCLLEVPADELARLEAGETFRLQTHSGGGAALCTGVKTWAVEFLENSNSQFLGFVPPETAAPADADGGAIGGEAAKAEIRLCKISIQVRGNLFCKATNSDVSRVREIVGRTNALKLPSEMHTIDEDAGSAIAPITTQMLEREVAISSAELNSTLSTGPYVAHDGVWRLLTPHYEREVLDIALSALTAKGLNRAAVDKAVLLDAVQEHFGESGAKVVPSAEVLEKVLRSVVAAEPKTDASKVGEKGENDGKEVAIEAPLDRSKFIPLDGDKVDQFQVLQLLHAQPSDVRRRFQLAPVAPRPKRSRVGSAATATVARGANAPLHLAELVEAFRTLSAGEVSDEQVLKILGEDVRYDELEGTVHALDVGGLPMDPKARLQKLFELQSHWRPEAIGSLIQPIIGTQKVEVWLGKWARVAFLELEPGKGEQRMFTRKFAGV